MLSVELKKKFTSENFEDIIDKYWNKSFKDLKIEFDLSSLEWIANEQIAFLIGWIRTLLEDKRSVDIILPKFSDDKAINNRRFNVTKKLLIDWNIQDVLRGDGYVKRNISYISGDIKTNHLKPSKESKFNSISHRIYDPLTFDRDFDRLHSEDFKELNEYIKNTLTEIDESDYFSSAHINYSLLKELISNSYQHAYNEDETQYKPIFLSLDFNVKIDEKYHNLKELLKDRYNERPLEEREYFIEKNNFVNQNFIEFSFFDFGNSIPSTLKDSFNREKIDDIKNELKSILSGQSLETQILEYAFLVWSSSYEIKKSLEIHNYIPRGLFIVKDIVKRYGGMLIVRSGKGKIVYDLRNDTEVIRFRKPEEESKIEVGFPGTIITFMLPTQNTTITHTKPDVNNIVYDLYKIEKIQLLTLVEKSKPIEIEKGKNIEFLQEFFGELCKILRKNHKEKSIIYFDFAGITKDTNDIFEKLIYFVSYSPFISKNHKVIFYNITDINLELDKHSMQSKGFEAYPIPYLLPNFKVFYIGIEASLSEKIVNEIWLTKTQEINQEYKPLLELVADEIIKLNGETIKDEIENKGIQFKRLIDGKDNFNDVKIDITNTKERFLISSNTYTSIYLRFIEKIYIPTYRKLIGTYLFTNYYHSKYLAYLKKTTINNNKSFADFWNEKDKINTILTVTLGTELVAKELKRLFNIFSNTKSSNIKQISLTTYFDFDGDEPYLNIKATDKIIIINDFISTGNFTKKVIYNISKKRNTQISNSDESEKKVQSVASVNAVLSIVDCREERDIQDDVNNKIFISLSKYIIKKEKQKPNQYSSIFVNPVLNNPTSQNEEYQNVLVNNTDFLYDTELRDLLEDDFFIIGNFKLNSTLHTHFVKTKEIFIQKKIFNFLIDKLIDKLQLERINNKKNSFEEDFIEFKNTFRKYFEGNLKQFEEKTEELETIYKLNKLKSSVSFNIQHKSNEKIRFDYIFYPYASTIVHLEDEKIIEEHKNTSKLGSYEIYSMPRILTPKGWRFTFPPKFLTIKSSSKPLSILIIDDGSCSGHTIEQMILALKGLKISEIIVLSFISRLEDFRLDFLTNIKQVKIKDELVPIKVYYGTHFNIHTYQKGFHPLDVLNAEIEKIKGYYYERLPDYLENLFKNLNLEYENPYDFENSLENTSKLYESEKSNSKKLNSFPSELNNTKVSKRASYLIRSYLGQYETFKHTKYDPAIDKIEGKKIPDYMLAGNRIYTTFATLYHEQRMIDILNKVHPEVKDKLQNVLYNHITATNCTPYDLFIFISIFYKFNKKTFLKDEKIKEIFVDNLPNRVGTDVNDVYNLIGFLLTKEIIIEKNDEISSLVKKFITDIFEKSKVQFEKDKQFKTYKYFRRFHMNLVTYPPTKKNVTIDLILALKSFYQKESDLELSHQNFQKFNSLMSITYEFKGFLNSKDETKLSSLQQRIIEWYHDQEFLTFLESIEKFIPVLNDNPTYFSKTDITTLENTIINSKQDIENFIQHKKAKDNNWDNFVENIGRLNTLTLSKNSGLYKFINSSQSDILSVWNDTLKLFNEDERIPLKMLSLESKAIINFHPHLLSVVFQNLIQNKNAHTPKNSRADYYLEVDYKLKAYILHCKQSSEFKIMTNSGGIGDMIVKLEYYQANYERVSEQPFYFKIFFPIP